MSRGYYLTLLPAPMCKGENGNEELEKKSELILKSDKKEMLKSILIYPSR